MHKFLITGLPRSRTAWMAEFMNHGSSVCFHEPPNWRELWSEYNDKCVGISDSGLGFQLDEIIEEYHPKILIIDRPIEEVEKSLDELNTGLPKTNFCEILKETLAKFQNGESEVLRVPFHSMNDIRVMQKIFWHLIPGEPFDEGRFLKMKNINIQTDVQKHLDNPATHYKFPKISVIQ